MPEKYPYTFRGWYPNMRPEDVAIWERFIAKNPKAFDAVSYDVEVGSPPPFDTNIIPGRPSDDVRLYKKKIDVVAFQANNIYIIELKPRAGMAALGQVNGYKQLYIRDFAPSSVPMAMVITDTLRLDMQELADQAKVLLVVV